MVQMYRMEFWKTICNFPFQRNPQWGFLTQEKVEQSSLPFRDHFSHHLSISSLQKFQSMHCNVWDVRCENPWHARNQSDKHMLVHRTMVRIDLCQKNGQNWPIVCRFDGFGGSARYPSVNGCFSWLPHLWGGGRGGSQDATGGSKCFLRSVSSLGANCCDLWFKMTMLPINILWYIMYR